MFAHSTFAESSLAISRYLAVTAAIAAPISTSIASIACVALPIFWLLSGHAIQSLKLSWQQPLGKMIVLFFAWLIIGTLYAETDWPSRLQTLSSWKKLFYTFLLLGFFQEAAWQKRFVRSYVIAMFIAAVLAVPLWALDLVVRNGREAGIFMTNHATQSMAFVAAVLACIFLLQEPLTKRQKYYVWSAIGLFLFNIFFISPARSGYFALPIAAVFAVGSIYGYRKLPHILGAATLAVLVLIISSNTLQDRIKLALDEKANYQTSSNETSIGLRAVFYKNTLELIQEKPWFGYGTSSFKSVYSTYAAGKAQDWHGISTGDPHNQYLFVWLENGLFGVLLFFAYIFVALRQGLNNRPYGPIAASFLVAICASSLFNSHFKTYAEGYLLAFFLGALLSQPNENTAIVRTNA
ncbi:O-antigen ligase family protein [Methylomonas sp. 2BW1-5-20]|uniref:O-antigen ligase family protein n=1 Tax=Methylomonas sp. 2BW1-5-20 TaxID=3376686 RepID=UPI00404D1F39